MTERDSGEISLPAVGPDTPGPRKLRKYRPGRPGCFKKKEGYGDFTRIKAYWILSILLLHVSEVSCMCKEDECSANYRAKIDRYQIYQGANREYCVVLKEYGDCLRSTARSCHYNLKYRTASTLAQQWISNYNCTAIVAKIDAGEFSFFSSSYNTADMYDDADMQPARPVERSRCDVRLFRRGRQRHCGLFGDPHLRTFTNNFQTCRILGAWPLVDNEYLAIQVTNRAVVDSGKATATTEVTVIIKGKAECGQQLTYQAQSGNLPSTFKGGALRSHSIVDNSVRIHERSPGRHIEIRVRFLSTTIVIRQFGSYLTISISMPEQMALPHANDEGFAAPSGDRLELCSSGCPFEERLDYAKFLSDPDKWIEELAAKSEIIIPKRVAIEMCRRYNITESYFDACVFDLLTTGDSSFRRAANSAFKDLKRLQPDLKLGNRTDLSPYTTFADSSGKVNAAAKIAPSIAKLTFVLLVHFFTFANHPR